MSRDRQRKVPPTVAHGKIEVSKKVGAGCFGEVYIGTHTETREEVAIKFEDSAAANAQLEHEAMMLNLLHVPMQQQGFAEMVAFGKEAGHFYLAMELLSKSLEDRLQTCNGRFSVRTTTLIADQVLQRIEYLHSKGIVHRDIKPENFMWGVKSKQHHLYLIDFGLSKRYFDRRHVMLRKKLSLTGTARYASLNAHSGMEQSRRDDLEAIGHMLVYFLRGSLPWSGLDARTKQEKYLKIRQKKESTPLQDLCAGLPPAFEVYLAYCRNLGFEERPDYRMLHKLFDDVQDKIQKAEGISIQDHDLDWIAGKDPGQLVPLERSQYVQPDDASQVRPRSWGFGWFCGGGGSGLNKLQVVE